MLRGVLTPTLTGYFRPLINIIGPSIRMFSRVLESFRPRRITRHS